MECRYFKISRPHFFKTKIVINPNQVTVFFGVTGWTIWDPGVSLALASSRRAERNTATSLDVKPHRLGKDGVGGGAADGPGAASDAWGGWPLRLVGS
ncbi:hypothetical protein THAOC_28882, partial [Thalassiosira oceanica]